MFQKNTSIRKKNTRAEQGDNRGRSLLDKVYLGIVKDTSDLQRMGRIRVYLPDVGGKPDNKDSWYTVSYCSPFAGATPVTMVKDSSDHFTNDQVSYGMWFPVPDIENEVIVVFINGDPNKGIFIGGRYQQNMNYMVPGIAGDVVDGEYQPVAEYNKKTEQNPDSPKRNAYLPLSEGLKMQGLLRDRIRGTSGSTARRQTTSRVYGFLTPRGSQIVFDDGFDIGEDQDPQTFNETSDRFNEETTNPSKRNPALDYIPKSSEGEGGPNRQDEFIRFRTRSGAQILINETYGMVYLISKDGRNWIEMANDGHVDVYAASSVSIHSGENINLQALEDVNIEAGRNINIKAVGSGSANTRGTGNIHVFSANSTHMTTGEDYRLSVGRSGEILVTSDFNVRSDSFNQNVTLDYKLCVGENQDIRVGKDRDDLVTNNIKTTVNQGNIETTIQSGNKITKLNAGNESRSINGIYEIELENEFILNSKENINISSEESILNKATSTYKIEASTIVLDGSLTMGGAGGGGANINGNIQIRGSLRVRDAIQSNSSITDGASNTFPSGPFDNTTSPSSPSAIETTLANPAIPKNPTVSTLPLIYDLSDTNVLILQSTCPRVPEHEPWKGHATGFLPAPTIHSSSENDITLTELQRQTRTPPPHVASKGRSQNVRRGNTNPTLSEDSVSKALQSVSKDVPPLGIPSAISGLRLSEQGAEFITSWEVYVAYEYPDGNWNSIGYGHSIRGNEPENVKAMIARGLTEEEAFELFKFDVEATYARDVRRYMKIPLRQHEFDALVDLCYNRGPGIFRRVGKLLNENKREEALTLFASLHAGHSSLVNRRIANVRLFREGKYEHEQTRTRRQLKRLGLNSYLLNSWKADNLWRSWRRAQPSGELGARVITQAYLAYHRSTQLEEFNLPDKLPDNRLVENVGRSRLDTILVKLQGTSPTQLG